MASISLCMIVRDEEANLPRSLKPIAPYFDEVVVVDTGSKDETVFLARQFGAKVFHIPWQDDFSLARNESIAFASGDWIMWFDADNSIKPYDAQRIRGLIDDHQDKIFWCTEVVEPEGSELIQKRIFPNRPDFRFAGPIHEQLAHPEEGIRYVMSNIKIYHWGYANKELMRQKGLRNLRILGEELRSRPEDCYLNFNIARCYQNLRKYEAALGHIKRVVRNRDRERGNPDIYFYAHIMMYMVHERLGEPDKAREALDLLLSKNPEFGLGWYYSGKYHFRNGSLRRASREFCRFQDLGIGIHSIDIPRRKIFLESYYWLAQCYESLGEPDLALGSYRKCIYYEPENSHVYLKLALLNQELGRKNKSRAYLEECLKLHPENRKARSALQGL